MITALHGAVSFQYLLEQDGQPVSQTKESNVLVENGNSDILTIDDLKQLEIKNLQRAVQHCEGKIFGEDGAAKLLGINPTTLISKLKKLGIRY